jgi:hypothetical protein
MRHVLIAQQLGFCFCNQAEVHFVSFVQAKEKRVASAAIICFLGRSTYK